MFLLSIFAVSNAKVTVKFQILSVFEMRDVRCEMRDVRCEMGNERWEMGDERWEMGDGR